MNRGIFVQVFVCMALLCCNPFMGCQSVVDPVSESSVVSDSLPLSIQVYCLYRAGGTGPLLPITSGEELTSGDHYKVYFRANRDCYIYVYQTESSGQVFRLFPLEQLDGVVLNHANPVKTLADYVLPADDRYFYLDDTTGKEKIYFVTSLQRNRDLESLDDQLAYALKANDDMLIADANREINAYLTNRGSAAMAKTQTLLVAWEASESVAPITGYLFETHQPDSIYSIEFMHR